MKRYFFRGREITRRKANLMVVGACAGMVGGAFGLFMLTIFLEALLKVVGA